MWDKTYEYSLIPKKVDPSPLNGKVLERARRSTAVSFSKAAVSCHLWRSVRVAPTAELVVMPRALCDSDINDINANLGARMVLGSGGGGQPSRALLRQAGVLYTVQESTASYRDLFTLAAYNIYFARLVYIRVCPQEHQYAKELERHRSMGRLETEAGTLRQMLFLPVS